MTYRRKQIIAVIMSLVLLFTALPLVPISGAFAAAVVDSSADPDIAVNSINYTMNMNGTQLSHAVVEILGSGGVDKANVTFGSSDIFSSIGTKLISGNTSSRVVYTLSASEVGKFNGMVYIGSDAVDISTEEFPTIDKLSDDTINTDYNESLVIDGGNLDKICTSSSSDGVKAEIVDGASSKQFYYDAAGGDDSSTITVEKATPTLSWGDQDVRLTESRADVVTQNGGSVNVEVTGYYSNLFRFIKNVGLENLSMYPNIGASGDYLYLKAKAFAGTEYGVYFLKKDEVDSFSDSNKGTSKLMSSGLLRVEIPDIDNGEYNIVVTTGSIGGEITAEQMVMDTSEDPAVPATFIVVQSTYRPSITLLSPDTLTDSGGTVEITGQYLLYPKLPSLEFGGGSLAIDRNTSVLSGNKAIIDYGSTGGITYGSRPATVEREMSVQIGDLTSFNSVNMTSTGGGPDKLSVAVPPIKGVSANTKMNVLISMTTTVKTDQDTYTFIQEVLVENGFTFTPSSIMPSIKDVTPSKVQVDSATNRPRNDTLISINGGDFLVDRYTDPVTKTTKVRYPKVYLKTGIDTESYGIGFFPNDGTSSGNRIGQIRLDDSDEPLLSGGSEVKFEMTVLGSDGTVVTGEAGNDRGTKILLKIPQDMPVPVEWINENTADQKENVQVTNPKRGSADDGLAVIKTNAVAFVDATSSPSIESVDPAVLSVDGGQTVKVTVTGPTDNYELFVDGQKVAYQKSTDINGKVVLTFTSPAIKREMVTQLLLLGSSGGSDVEDLVFIRTFAAAPTIASFNPIKGTPETLVSINGDNYVKPDPSVGGEEGLDAFRLIGTRVFLDGKDVNSYNLTDGKISFREFSGSEAVIGLTEGLKSIPYLAPYADALILKVSGKNSYYTIGYDFGGSIILTNGKDSYRVTYDYDSVTPKFIATKPGSTPVDLIPGNDKITLDRTDLMFTTPYEVSGTDIVGKRTRVVSKNQTVFSVPNLGKTGTSFVDLAVVNPDTKKAEKTGTSGFEYIQQADRHPYVEGINPDRGSTVGGYFTEITGSNFDEGVSLYIDGVLVAAGDTHVSLDGTRIVAKVPKCTKDLRNDYKVDQFSVPVVVVNENGGSFSLEKGFTYISPLSKPNITMMRETSGSANGGEVVKLEGTQFVFKEPYTDANMDGQRNDNELYDDLNNNGIHDDLLGDSDAYERLPLVPKARTYTSYYESDILPDIYFGDKKAKIVEFRSNSIYVATPANAKGAVDVYLVNNDYGLSNKLKYTYTSSAPTVTLVDPSKGAKAGQEIKDVYGSGFALSKVNGYEPAEGGDGGYGSPVALDNVDSVVRFGDIDNVNSGTRDENLGDIFGGNADVSLPGGLDIRLDGENKELEFTLNEDNRLYKGKFGNFTGDPVYVPIGMLMGEGSNEPYVPYGYSKPDGVPYMPYEYVKAYIIDGMLKVERGYAPDVTYDNSGHIQIMTPCYHTIGQVNLYIKNTDGGVAKAKFTYMNPASKPRILTVQPSKPSADGKKMMVEGAINGNKVIEVLGRDFRKGVKVTIANKSAEILDMTSRVSGGVTYDCIIVKVPTGTEADIDRQYPVIVENTDGAIASSATEGNLIDADTTDSNSPLPIYFVYRKPLSGPKITSISKSETSVSGHHDVIIYGSDFRPGAKVIIGSRGAVPITVATQDIDLKGTYLKFEVPENLTLGLKSIQVENPDFGIGTLDNAIKIVSYPYTSPTVLDPKGNPVTRISVEGGEKITIKGRDFDKSPKVVFGGRRVLKTTQTGPVGLWKDDKYYVVESGVLAASVKVIDSSTLEVTVPKSDKEKSAIVTVINGDGGLADPNISLTYRDPIPADPINLKARTVSDRYMELYGFSAELGSQSEGNHYSVYYYIGSKTADQVVAAGYADMRYYGTTDRNPLKITSLPGFEKRGSSDSVHFVLKAGNKFGYSGYSNIATIQPSQTAYMTDMGEPDYDGKLGVPEGASYGISQRGSGVTLALSSTLVGDTYVDMKRYSSLSERSVIIPGSRVIGDDSSVTADFRDASFTMTPESFATDEYGSVSYGSFPYAVFKDVKLGDGLSLMIESLIPGSKKRMTVAHSIQFRAANNDASTSISRLAGGVSMKFRYDPSDAGNGENTVKLYKYSASTESWRAVSGRLSTAGNYVTYTTYTPGVFMLMADRYASK